MNINRSLRTKLIFQYMVIVLVCMLVIPTAIAKLLDRQFRDFALERLQSDEAEMTEYFAKLYAVAGSWRRGRGVFPRDADFLRWPMVSLRIIDANGYPVIEYSRIVGSRAKRAGHVGRGKYIIPDVPETAEIPSADLKLSARDIYVNDVKVGELRFSSLSFNNSPEGKFLREFNKIMYYAVALMLVIAAGIAVFMAYRISRPVLKAAQRAKEISQGNYRMEDSMQSDITELQTLIDSVDKLGESLEEQEELRKRLLSDVAHELRNPVTIIKSHLEAIEDGVWQPTPERIKLTVSEVDRLSQLIREVEKLTYIESAAHSLAEEDTDVTSVVERAVMVYEPLFKNKNVELKSDIERGVMASLDGAKIRQAIENLLSNALRYTDAGGVVSCTMKTNDDEIITEISDSGIGIAASDVPYIFERFYRTDVSRARTSGGIGIGLAIVKAIVEAHGGEISVTSKQGEGSCFTVKIPKKRAR